MIKKKRNKRDEFLTLIPPGAKKVLDVGCGDGSLGVKLKEKGIEVIGIEKDNQLYLQAKKKFNEVFCMDAEDVKLPYPQGYFDCILCVDILEHLRDPFSTLIKLSYYLGYNGAIIASIPNVRYYKIIIRLVCGGTWDYVDSGILDRGHIRFFTLINIKELFTASMYKIIKIKRNIVAAWGFKMMNFLFLNKLRDFLTYQYYIKAIKIEGSYINYNSKQRKIYRF